jgi:recombination protein RecA
MDRAMTTTQTPTDAPPSTPSREPLGSALARLEARWGSVAIRLGNGGRIDRPSAGQTPNTGPPSSATATLGALALAPMPDLEPASAPTPSPGHRSAPDPAIEAVSTGFPTLDAWLGIGGLPRRAGATLRGDASSGKTTLALRSVASAQAAGGIVAWLDVGRTFDPLEAAARGVDLSWLVVLRPAEMGEGLRLAGALVSGRAVDLLVLDLPPRLALANEALLRRLAAHARRIGVQLLVLEPLDLAAPLHGALAEAAGVRLELERVGWLRHGRDIVGQRTAVTVSKNHFGPPGQHVELEIHYLDDGERAAGVARLLDASPTSTTGPPRPRPVPSSPARSVQKPPTQLVTIDHAPPPPRLAQPLAPPRARPTRPALDADDAAGPGRPAVGSGQRPRPQPGRGPLRRPAGAAAGSGAPARP